MERKMFPGTVNCTDYLAHGPHYELPSMSLVLSKLWNRWLLRLNSSVWLDSLHWLWFVSLLEYASHPDFDTYHNFSITPAWIYYVPEKLPLILYWFCTTVILKKTTVPKTCIKFLWIFFFSLLIKWHYWKKYFLNFQILKPCHNAPLPNPIQNQSLTHF